MGLWATITLDFDPLLRLGDLTVRWQTVGVTLALLLALSLGALMAPDLDARRPLFRRGQPDLRPRFPSAPVVGPGGEVDRPPEAHTVRLDDMVLIVCGVVPGAVLVGRLVHAIAFWDAYAAAPLKVFDPGVGGLSLLGAVLGGTLGATYVARLLGAPVRRWMDAAAVPLLLAIGLGKMAQLLGGSGQGLPFDGPWAVAFGGGGPWVSTNPDLPSHPSQLYEGLWALVGIPIVLWLTGPRRPPRSTRVNPWLAFAERAAPEGRLFANALTLFLAGRVVVGFTWRDDSLVGPLNVEQILAICAVAAVQVAARMSFIDPLGTAVTARNSPP